MDIPAIFFPHMNLLVLSPEFIIIALVTGDNVDMVVGEEGWGCSNGGQEIGREIRCFAKYMGARRSLRR